MHRHGRISASDEADKADRRKFGIFGIYAIDQRESWNDALLFFLSLGSTSSLLTDIAFVRP